MLGPSASQSPAAHPHSKSPETVQATVIADPDVVPGLRDVWRELAVARGNPFVTPEWFDAWRRVDAGESRPLIIVARRGDEVVGVLPLTIRSGRFGERVEVAGAEFGDCFHPACPIEAEIAIASAAGRVLDERGWSSMYLRNSLAGTGWHEVLSGGAGARGALISFPPKVLPYVELGNRDWTDFLASRSRNFRKGLWRSMRRLKEQGDVRFRLTEDLESLDSDLSRLFKLHDEVWGSRSGFLSERGTTFHSTFARSALERGWLRLGSLELDGRVIAATIGWRLGSRMNEFQRGYALDMKQFSPGKIVMGEMMRALNEEGATVYDQLLGDEAYKLQIADGTRSVETFRAGRPWRTGAAAVRAESLARTAYTHAPEGFRTALRKRRYPSLS